MKEQLTEEQKKFLTAEGKVVVKACPGSGKTYSVAHKLLSYIDNWKDYHSGVAVLSFTNVASNEIQEKAQTIHGSLGELGYPHFIGTVDSFIDEFIVLRYGHLDTVSNVRPRITITDTWKMPYGFWRKECHSKGCIDNIEQFYYGIDKKFYKGNEPVKCEKRNARSLPCQQYKKMLQDRGIIFQNETALFAYQLLKKYPMVASAIAERFPVIIIDEAQDTSVNQMAVFDLLSKSGVKSMFLVGDADQSIYEWRNASPECFLQKVEDTSWQTIELTGNFRSSQNICNVTSYFSASLRGTKSNNAIGYWKDEVQKPILLLTKNNSENDTIDYFIKKCMEMQIGISPKNVAVLTRGRIYSDTDIKGLWKSAEIELYAKAAYEWKYGSRKKAYENTEKATYCMIFNEDTDKYMMQQKIREHTTEESWKDFIINILINIPDVDMEIAEWVKEFSTIFVDVCKNCEYKISPDKEIKDTFKIKRNDNKSPDFKKISLKKFFEKKNEEKYTRSSIHGVKGESYEAVLLHVKSRTGSTITPKLLMEGELEQELMRLAYVAMTRPRRLLMLAMPDQDLQQRGTNPMVEVFKNRIEFSNAGAPLVAIERIVDSVPVSRNENIAGFMHKCGICEERGSGYDKIVEATGKNELLAPRIENQNNQFTKAILFAKVPFELTTKEDRMRTCYMQACLAYVNFEGISNSDIRKIFGLGEKEKAKASRLLTSAVDGGYIKVMDPDTAPRYKKYIPYWA